MANRDKQAMTHCEKPRQKGFALIDILLSLVIVMILMIASFLYWQSNRRANLNEAGYQLLQAIIEAAQGWQPTEVNQGRYSGISANGLLREGNIPRVYISNFDGNSSDNIPVGDNTGLTTPWGGSSQVSVSQSDRGVLEIVFDKIPNYACNNLANRVNGDSGIAHPGVSIDPDNMDNIDTAQCQQKQDSFTLTVWYHPDF